MSLSSALGSVLPGTRITVNRSIHKLNSGGFRSVRGVGSDLRLSGIKCHITSPTRRDLSGDFQATRRIPLKWDKSNRSKRGDRMICSASALDYETLQWISSISCLVLMFSRGTAINKSFLAPLFVLQSPASVISWIRCDYGLSTAFIALLVRLFFHIPGELELPFLTALLVIVTPYQASGLRGTKIGVMISLLIAGYVAFQHFSRVGGLGKAFDQGSIPATLAIICITAVSCFFLF